MVTFFTIPRAIRPLEKAWAEFIQGSVTILTQHAASRLIDCYDATILINKNNPLVEIIKNLFQFRQSNHKYLCS